MPANRIEDPWGERSPYGPGEQWPIREDMYLEEGLTADDVDRWVQTASILHSNGDGLYTAVKDGRIVGVKGRATDRVNHGRVDPKDLYGWKANNSPDRLTRPLIRENGRLVETDWDTAMNRIVEESKKRISEPGGEGRIGFYTTGQMFIEDYYTLGVIGKGGIGTPHMDGNTRLCTATAAEALKETFGSDGQPGSYTDVDHCDTIALWGHNVAETQTVLWMRMLDRRRGPNPAAMLAVDPRSTAVTREADVHLAPRNGTNLALMNGILRELIHREWYDKDYVEAHSIGFEDMAKVVEAYPPEKVAEICDISQDDFFAAIELLGASERLLSTVLQGFYQSNQATASAMQVNNLHVLRGAIGKPGAGLYQMNGQPTAQNTRECGADGDLPAFRNWDNPDHMQELADLWNVKVDKIPHWGPPTHAMQIWRYAEQGSIDFLWITCTNPAVSLPELGRIRKILEKPELFTIVQDIFMTETAQYADVVLPAGTWGEKTGTFTNVDRTVHLAEKAVEPPGEAKPDFYILLDYAQRMDFRDKDGEPLIKWHDPESAFEAWKKCTAGRPCDYTGLSYEKLRGGGSGVQWPCNEEYPDGKERLYTDGVFNTQFDNAETYGKDLKTGASLGASTFKTMAPEGRAMLRTDHYRPSPEVTTDEYPLLLTTGRTVYHFHTRTKTGRAPELQDAAPNVWVELSVDDAKTYGISEGDMVRVASPRGSLSGRCRISGIRPGVIFIPFHYGYWDIDDEGRPVEGGRAANELTITSWDPVSNQPLFKVGAVRVEKLAEMDVSVPSAPDIGGSMMAEVAR